MSKDRVLEEIALNTREILRWVERDLKDALKQLKGMEFTRDEIVAIIDDFSEK